MLFGWYLGTLKTPVSNSLISFILPLSKPPSNEITCLAPLTELPWNLTSLSDTKPSRSTLTDGPSGYLPSHKLKRIFLLTSKYIKYLVLCVWHNSLICSLTSMLMRQYRLFRVCTIFSHEAWGKRLTTWSSFAWRSFPLMRPLGFCFCSPTRDLPLNRRLAILMPLLIL